MYIKEINSEIFDEMPHLKEMGFRDIDINLLVRVYERHLTDAFMKNDDFIYTDFMRIGKISMPLGTLIRKGYIITGKKIMSDENIVEVNSILKLLEQWRNMFIDYTIYLEGVEDKNIKSYYDISKRSIVGVTTMINRIREKLKKYDERITSRNMEEQMEDSGRTEE